MQEKFDGIFIHNGKVYTKNLVPGRRVYGEELLKFEGTEYRSWDPTRSKLSAAIVKGLDKIPIKAGSTVLYLGAATGTTPSHISDIVGENGIVYCIEFSERAMRDLIHVCNARGNMVPMLSDARMMGYGTEKADVVYCDIAQPDQTSVAIRNANEYLKENGVLMLVIKSRSIDVVKSPRDVYQQEEEKLKEAGYKILDTRILDPYEKDHAFFVSVPVKRQ